MPNAEFFSLISRPPPRPVRDFEIDEPEPTAALNSPVERPLDTCEQLIDRGNNCWTETVDRTNGGREPYNCTEACLKPQNVNGFINSLMKHKPDQVELKPLFRGVDDDVKLTLTVIDTMIMLLETTPGNTDPDRMQLKLGGGRKYSDVLDDFMDGLDDEDGTLALQYTVTVKLLGDTVSEEQLKNFSGERYAVRVMSQSQLFLPDTFAKWKLVKSDSQRVRNVWVLTLKYAKIIPLTKRMLHMRRDRPDSAGYS
jgi:hypothetical protein